MVACLVSVRSYSREHFENKMIEASRIKFNITLVAKTIREAYRACPFCLFRKEFTEEHGNSGNKVIGFLRDYDDMHERRFWVLFAVEKSIKDACSRKKSINILSIGVDIYTQRFPYVSEYFASFWDCTVNFYEADIDEDKAILYGAGKVTFHLDILDLEKIKSHEITSALKKNSMDIVLSLGVPIDCGGRIQNFLKSYHYLLSLNGILWTHEYGGMIQKKEPELMSLWSHFSLKDRSTYVANFSKSTRPSPCEDTNMNGITLGWFSMHQKIN